jgi:hypothetical protein
MLILLSSTGFIVNMHFCQEHLIDIAVMAPAHSCCGDSVDEGSCCDMNIDSKSDHCKDESISVETSEVYLSSIFSYNFEDNFQFELPWLSSNTSEILASEQNNFRSILDFRKPPTLKKVDLSKIQAFLL